MKKTLLLTALLAFNLSAITYEDESSETREYYIKLNVVGERSDSGAMARIEIKLFDSENMPLAGVPVALKNMIMRFLSLEDPCRRACCP